MGDALPFADQAGAGDHADGRRQNVRPGSDAGQPQCVVENIEGKQWYQTNEGDELPAFVLNAHKQLLHFALEAVHLSFHTGHLFGGDAIEQTTLAADQSHIDVQRLCDPVFGQTGFDRFQDHLVLLNGGQAADALVAGESLVIGCDQTHGVLRAKILQDLKADMAVEQQISAPVSLLAGNHQRFDQADFANGAAICLYLRPVLVMPPVA